MQILGDVVIGEDGWLFLTGGSNEVLRYYTDPSFFNDHHRYAWAALLTDRAKRCQNSGISYLHLSAPDKLSVYADKIGRFLNFTEAPPTQSIPHYLSVNGKAEAITSWIDVLPALKASPVAPYWRTDTHWTFDGAYVAYLAICGALGAEPNKDILERDTAIQEIPLDLGGRFSPPITERFGIKQILRDASRTVANELVIAKERHNLNGDAGLHIGSDVTFANSWEGRDPRRVLIFGDSFSEYRPLLLTGLLAETFTETRFVWSTQVDWSVVDQFKPDVLITEIAERFMRQVPDDDSFSLAHLVHHKMLRVEALLKAPA